MIMRRARAMLAILTFLLGATAAAPASAQEFAIGLYAPTAPFDGPEARFQYVTDLADHLQDKLGRKVVGRAFAKAVDFQAAVKAGELQFAVVDGPYAAALGLPWDTLAAATNGGHATTAWEIVARSDVRTLADLKGATIAAPSLGARDDAFLTNVLLAGEVGASYFGKIVGSPDSLSAVAAVGTGRADAALVPAGLPLPDGVRRTLALRELGWAQLVALPGADAETRKAVAGALAGFQSTVFDGFGAPGAGAFAELKQAFSKPQRRGPLAVPAPHADTRALLVGRKFRIEPADLAHLVAPPEPKVK